MNRAPQIVGQATDIEKFRSDINTYGFTLAPVPQHKGRGISHRETHPREGTNKQPNRNPVNIPETLIPSNNITDLSTSNNDTIMNTNPTSNIPANTTIPSNNVSTFMSIDENIDIDSRKKRKRTKENIKLGNSNNTYSNENTKPNNPLRVSSRVTKGKHTTKNNEQ
jgi:hypothetical protein